VLALGFACGPLAAQVQVVSPSGTVMVVDLAANKIVMLDPATSREIDVRFVDRPQIVTTTGMPLQFQNLKRGDRVSLVYSGGLVARAVVNQAPLKGVISNIDLNAQKLVVTESETNRDIEVALNPSTRIETGQHKPLALKDIKTGDGTAIIFSGATPVDVAINSKPPELKGHIKSVAGDLRSLVLTELGSGGDITVAVTPETTIVSKSGKSLGMNDLKKGDGVGITHHASVASLIVVNPITTTP
jgi:hypothetical protein